MSVAAFVCGKRMANVWAVREDLTILACLCSDCPLLSLKGRMLSSIFSVPNWVLVLSGRLSVLEGECLTLSWYAERSILHSPFKSSASAAKGSQGMSQSWSSQTRSIAKAMPRLTEQCGLQDM